LSIDAPYFYEYYSILAQSCQLYCQVVIRRFDKEG